MLLLNPASGLTAQKDFDLLNDHNKCFLVYHHLGSIHIYVSRIMGRSAAILPAIPNHGKSRDAHFQRHFFWAWGIPRFCLCDFTAIHRVSIAAKSLHWKWWERSHDCPKICHDSGRIKVLLEAMGIAQAPLRFCPRSGMRRCEQSLKYDLRQNFFC